MGRANPTVLFGFFVALIVAICGTSLLAGGLWIGNYEGDTLHMLDIATRMQMGQVPHLDFVTPLGGLAFWPIALFMRLGFAGGQAFVLAQLAVAILILPALWWVAYSRLRGALAYFLGLVVLVLVLGLLHGGTDSLVSVSMHYNRWGWAIAFVAIVAAVMPAEGRDHSRWDGVIIGAAMAALAMIKMTYFVAFAPAVLVAMLARGAFRSLLFALLTGLAVAGVITLLWGTGYWRAYLLDLLAVAGSTTRAAPGLPFADVASAPAFLPATVALLGGVILLRQAGAGIAGLTLLLLAPGFIFVTYQNFGNDPQWLLLLFVLLLAHRPVLDIRNAFGWDMRSALAILTAAVLALAAPGFLNLAYSPLRHLGAEVEDYTPLLPGSALAGDIHVFRERALKVAVRSSIGGPGSGLEGLPDAGEETAPLTLNGEVLADCTVETGMTGWMQAIADDLEASGIARGRVVLAADILNAFWLMGDFQAPRHGAPWYYGGTPGLAEAELILVPLCPVIAPSRRLWLEAIAATGQPLVELRRTPLYLLFGKG